jgi:hypothetical protein
MNEYDVRRLALVLSVQAEIEAMKVENEVNKIQGLPLTYNQNQFEAKANRLSDLAYAHNEQLF